MCDSLFLLEWRDTITIMKRIKNFLFKLIYVMIIIYLLVFLPILWGYKPLVIISGSMEPTLKTGGILYYHEEKLENFKTNDILVYKTRNHIVSHRVIENLDVGFITKGDANRSNDSDIIEKTRVLGKGTNWCIPLLGLYADFIYTHKYLLFISVAILLIDLCHEYYINHKKKVGVHNEKI